jgi:hypothetical protein
MDLNRLSAAAMSIICALTVSAGSGFAAENDDAVAAVQRYLAHIDKLETIWDSAT